MNKDELRDFMAKYKLSPRTLSEIVGITPAAVDHWLEGRRSIAKPYGRLFRLFDRNPTLMQDFK